MNEKDKAYQLLLENGSTDKKVLRALLLENGFTFDNASVVGIFGKAAQVNRYRHSPMKDKKPVKGDSGSIIALYREWCIGNDHVSTDEELAHFTGKTSQAFYAARRRASETGFTFEKNGSGWIVKVRPDDKRKKEISEISQAIQELQKRLQELSA